MHPWTNKRTGETHQVPVGIDPGFDHNVGLLGRAETAQRMLEDKIAAAAPDIAAVARRDMLAAAHFIAHSHPAIGP